MNHASRITMKPGADATVNSVELQAQGAALPIWLIVLSALLTFWGAVYFDDHSGWFNTSVYKPFHSIAEVLEYQPQQIRHPRSHGSIMYEAACAICHGSDGKGKSGQAPPLAGSEWVNAVGVNRLVRIPVLGLNGPIEVSGQTYSFPSGGMTAVAPQFMRTSTFTDGQLADVLTYIRSAWGNSAPPVTEAEVKAIRDDIGSRTTALTVDEAKSLPKEWKK